MTFDYNPTPPAVIKNYKELRLKVPTDFYFISILRPIVALIKLKFPLRDNNIFYFLFQILNNFHVLLISVQQQEELSVSSLDKRNSGDSMVEVARLLYSSSFSSSSVVRGTNT